MEFEADDEGFFEDTEKVPECPLAEPPQFFGLGSSV